LVAELGFVDVHPSDEPCHVSADKTGGWCLRRGRADGTAHEGAEGQNEQSMARHTP
jgi:hypothetical protein